MTHPALSSLADQLLLRLRPELIGEQPSVVSSIEERILREIKSDTRGGSRKVWEDVHGSLSGLIRTARIRVYHDLADGLEKAVDRVDQNRQLGSSGWEGDMAVKASNVPQHVQLLLNLSQGPSAATHNFAHDYLSRVSASGPTPDQILYAEIMDSEPFEGDHWGPGYDDEVREGWSDSDSSDLGSTTEEEVLTPMSRKGKVVTATRQAHLGCDDGGMSADEVRMMEAQERLRKLDAEAYWRSGGVEVENSASIGFGWKEISSGLCSSTLTVLEGSHATRKVITAEQLQRELLFALSGRSGVFFDFRSSGKCQIHPNHPGVRQYSSEALAGVLHDFRDRAEQASSIRQFITNSLFPTDSSRIASGLSGPSSSTSSMTKQAFAEACRRYMEFYERWISDLEASFTMGSDLAVPSTSFPWVSAPTTPLMLRLELGARFGDMITILSQLILHADQPTTLLDMIYASIISLKSAQFAAQTQSALFHVFLQSATPVWNMLGDWMIRGMPVPSSLITSSIDYSSNSTSWEDERKLSTEFLIKRDRDVSWADEDFWEAGYVDDEAGWPSWLEADGLKDAIIEGGKARGLLHSLVGPRDQKLEAWPELSSLLLGETLKVNRLENSRTAPRLAVQHDVKIPKVPDCISDHVTPMSQIAQVKLRNVLEEDCGLQQHLDAIEGIMYMKAFEVMDDWGEWLFTQMQSSRPWSDFQILTSSFRDAVDKASALWLNPSAVRIRTLRRVDRVGNGTDLAALSAIRADYQVPFPLSQLFSSTSIDLRAQVFCFLLQIQRARKSLISTRLLDAKSTTISEQKNDDDKAVWKVRQRLAWLIDAIWIWITERVIELETRSYRTQLQNMSSFRAMIGLELQHARRIRDFCFLHDNTAALRTAVHDVLTMSIIFTECYAFHHSASNVGTKVPLSVQTAHQKSSRDRKRPQSTVTETSDEDSGDGIHLVPDESLSDTTIRHASAASIRFAEIGFRRRLDLLNTELDQKMEKIRTEVVNLAGKDGDSSCDGNSIRATWGVLSFALESDGWNR